LARLIAGRAFGLTNPVRMQSPLFYVHAELQAGGRIGIPSEYPERAAYVVTGRVEADGREHGPGQMLVFAGPSNPVLTAVEASTVMLLGDEPLGPRHIWWNFVSSCQDRIEQAKADWQSGRIHLPLHDDQEFIPLPADPKPAPEPMS
jgi:redox-sensitive bicupin YhaK (pirin superfamily)